MRPLLRVIEGNAPATAPGRALELMALGAGLTLAFSLAAALPSWRTDLGRLQALFAVAFGFYALAVANLARWRTLPHAGLAVFVVALAVRIAVLRVEPSLSDDVYRYVWDGRVLAHGIDPWRYAPADTALAALRDAGIHPRVNHPDLRTIYPPLAEGGFALVSWLAPGVRGMKLWIALHDLALVALLCAWSARRSGFAAPALVYAWNPLVVLEYAGSGHHEPTMLLWLVLAFAVCEERPLLSAGAFAAGVLVKLSPLVVLPLLWVRWPWRARALALALLVPGLAAFARLAGGPHSGLLAYAGTWRNNELAFDLVARVVGDRGARVAAALAVALVVAGLLWKRVDAAVGARRAMRTVLLAGPVLHPWYLGWALVFEPLGPSAPWLLFSAMAILNYGVLAAPKQGGAFHLPFAWRALEYGLPVALGIVLALWRRTPEGPKRA